MVIEVVYIFAGSPGSGKTTQAKLLESKLDFKWISAGQLLREKSQGAVRQQLVSGSLVNDELVNRLVKKELDKYEDHSMVILDGFPRDFEEARWLVEEYGALVEAYIILELPQQQVMNRLLKRGRPDDRPKVIEKRIKIFKEESGGVIDYFDHIGTPIIKVDGSGSIDQVHLNLKQVLNI